MARSTNIEFSSWITTQRADIDLKIAANGIRAITGPILNDVLNNMMDGYDRIVASILFAWQESESEAITTAANPNIITFPTAFLSGETYQLVLRNYDASGSNVDYQVTAMTETNFSIVTAANSRLHYFTILNV